MINLELPKLYAVIGVWTRGKKAYYVQRSLEMENYPGVWSLFSIQYYHAAIPNAEDLKTVQAYMERMSAERLNSVGVKTLELLSEDNSSKNTIDKHVYLRLYRVDLEHEPQLNPRYYTSGKWMDFEEYQEVSAELPCGLCTRMWGDWAYLHCIIDHPFIPRGGKEQ